MMYIFNSFSMVANLSWRELVSDFRSAINCCCSCIALMRTESHGAEFMLWIIIPPCSETSSLTPVTALGMISCNWCAIIPSTTVPSFWEPDWHTWSIYSQHQWHKPLGILPRRKYIDLILRRNDSCWSMNDTLLQLLGSSKFHTWYSVINCWGVRKSSIQNQDLPWWRFESSSVHKVGS